MSKADKLGTGSAFGAAATARSSRRDAIESTIGAQAAATAAITDLPVTLISDNPDNPRNHLRNLEETVQTVREVGVLIPIVVATVDAYLYDRPDRDSDIDDGAQYIVVDGHRRLEAARRVGMATIPVRVDNARVATDEALLEAAFIANYHRDDMTDLEEAHALQSLVDYYGSQTKASKRLGIPQNTISSKLSLLKLSPELQKDLVNGERTVEHVRNLGKLSPEEQKKADERRAAAERRKPLQQMAEPPQATGEGAQPKDRVEDTGQLSRRDNSGQAPSLPAAEEEQPGEQAGGTDEVSRRDSSEPTPSRTSHQQETGLPLGDGKRIPEPRPQDDGQSPAATQTTQHHRLPYDQPPLVAMHLRRQMDEDGFFELLRLLSIKARELDRTRFEKLLATFTEAPSMQVD
ncbi:ParB/RepB/Spo0J family partition protein [Streptomyces sp. NPDC007205]|uniref:ParB/RepB/Spo0J family partition protein n=1 Tax=Streptomyces sp. NPDC007205 TaxID=3154316 RepID=UPI0033D6F068